MTRPNSVTTAYSYQPQTSWLASVLHKKGATTLDGATYTYDAAGNRQTKLNAQNNVTSGYTYDGIYELTKVVQGTTTTESYTYDAVGNRLSSLTVPLYNYNPSNELTSNSSGSYTYDSNGNTLTDAQGRSFTWDFENRLTQVVNPGVGTTTFRYDPFGRRIQKSGPLGTTNYLYDGASLLEELDNLGSVLARYAEGRAIDQPLSEIRSGTTSYYDADGLGSITSLTSSSGATTATYVYDAFGNLSGSTGSVVNPFRYTGREFDSETGLFFHRARYYDAASGRFTGEDPARFVGGTNFYPYAINSPTNYVDPTGLLAELYCERIPSSRAGARNSVLLFIAQPVHCYLRVACHGNDVYVELYGPPANPDGSLGKFGIPHNDNPYNPDRARNSSWMKPLHPAGTGCCQFEDRLMNCFQQQAGSLPAYNPLGPNSNTFAYNVIACAGGTAEFPANAYGVGNNLEHFLEVIDPH